MTSKDSHEDNETKARRARDRALATVRVAYAQVIGPAKAAYNKVRARIRIWAWARAASNKAEASAWVTYMETTVRARAACREAETQAKKAHDAAKAQAWATYWEIRTRAKAAYDEAEARARAR